MHQITKTARITAMAALLLMGTAAMSARPLQAAQSTASQASGVRAVGTVNSISGNTFVLTPDSGSEATVQVQDSARIVRIAPGQKDLKDAAAAQLQDVQVGDRVLVRGKAGADSKTLLATTVVLMKSGDIAQKQQQERQDWDKRGIGGLVKSVDPATGVIAVSTGPSKTVAVETSKNTIIRRYAPASVKFDDAVTATLNDIKPGDQLRARGNHNADGTELTAEELVAGTFRNVAGLIASVDGSKKTITVTDLLTKKPVTVNFTADSQMHQLPAMLAQRIAMRLKGTAPNGAGAPNGAPAQHPQEPMQAGGSRGQHPGGAGDVQQILNNMPAVTLADLKKGDAVMIVTTQAQASGEVTAITLLSGVEPILAASPNDNRAAMLLSPWNLGSGGPENE